MRAIIAVCVVILAVVGLYFVVEESNDSPLENAAEDLDNTIDELDN